MRIKNIKYQILGQRQNQKTKKKNSGLLNQVGFLINFIARFRISKLILEENSSVP